MALAAFEPHGIPVVSLYLNLTPDQHGRDNYHIFARKAFADQLKRLDEKSAEHASLEREHALTHDRAHCPFRDGPIVREWTPAHGWRTVRG